MQKLTSFKIQKWLRSLIAGLTVIWVLGTANFTAPLLAKEVNDVSFDLPLAMAQIPNILATELFSDKGNFWDQEKGLYSETPNITVYRSPDCGCCGKWMEHLTKQGFRVKEIKTYYMTAIEQKYNLPLELASCHTALIDRYIIEGHVPAEDIKSLLKEKPNIAGLSVPGMPVGSPGMEAGERKDPFTVIAFAKNGKVKVFKEYQSY